MMKQKTELLMLQLLKKGTVYFKAKKYKLALKVYKRGYGLVDKVCIYKH